MDAMKLVSLCLLSMIIAGVLIGAQAGAEAQPPAQEAWETLQVQDLRMIRELDARVKKGEISEQERAQLWQAYLARLAAKAGRDVERPTKKRKSSVFTGPGL